MTRRAGHRGGTALAGVLLLSACAHRAPLTVELTWDGARADVDLHVSVKPPAELFGPDTVSFCRPGPDGPDGARLDIDDRGGFGPERVVVDKPVGPYGVRVHYAAPQGDEDVVATVGVRSGRVTLWSGSQTLSPEQVWSVGVVGPDARFAPSTEALLDDVPTDCSGG